MYEENKGIEFDEEVDIEQSPNCCWRCHSSYVGVEDTTPELDTIVVEYVCNDCSSTWQVKYEPMTLFIATQ
ncbi:hypothetical protein MEG05_03645 [Vibrio aestuarianus]|uniref:hypothetical protein n=1 Tax=Vibrio aestuarianus TaxID=28171 RepID=UPI00237D1EBA|nr:hypothetical protein [Vibrio aestuarianus]MDE1313393.1 hypothetical protein [Vibrio aestuarianus]